MRTRIWAIVLNEEHDEPSTLSPMYAVQAEAAAAAVTYMKMAYEDRMEGLEDLVERAKKEVLKKYAVVASYRSASATKSALTRKNSDEIALLEKRAALWEEYLELLRAADFESWVSHSKEWARESGLWKGCWKYLIDLKSFELEVPDGWDPKSV